MVNLGVNSMCSVCPALLRVEVSNTITHVITSIDHNIRKLLNQLVLKLVIFG